MVMTMGLVEAHGDCAPDAPIFIQYGGGEDFVGSPL